MTFFILRKDVSKITRSIVSIARSVCFAVPTMVPGVDGVVGNVIVSVRSMFVVRMDW